MRESTTTPIYHCTLERAAWTERGGITFLRRSAERGYENITPSLLELGADPKAKGSKSDRTALSYAAKKGHVRIIKLLLEEGKKDHAHKVEIPLSGMEYERISKLFVELEPDWPQKSNAELILFALCGVGDRRAVSLLLDRGVNPNVRLHGSIPIHAASMGGHLTVVQLLQKRGALRKPTSFTTQTET